jgi:hypothetical protein
MRTLFTILTSLLLTAHIIAQSPSKMSYQAVIRNSSDNLVQNKQLGMKISILQGSNTGSSVYTETQTPVTNANGLVNIEIGSGTVVSGDFSTIIWSNGPYFIKTETDLSGGTNYTITGTSQLLSVPYALYADKAGNGFSGKYGDLSNKPNLATVALTGSYNDLLNKPTFDGTWTSLTGKPTFSTVAITGSYSDLTNKPTLFDGSWASLTGKPVLANVATSGNYNDLINKPTDVGLQISSPTTYQSWGPNEYAIKTLTSITMTLPKSGYVLLIHTGHVVFFGQNREFYAGIGTTITSMISKVEMGYLDGSSTLRYEVPYSVTTVVPVSAGIQTFYALGGGNSTFESGYVNMVPQSFVGVFIPKLY